MKNRIPHKAISLLLTFLCVIGVFSPLGGITALAATEYISFDYIMAETTRSVSVGFHFNRDIDQTDFSRLAVWLYKQDGTLLTHYDFDLTRRYIDYGTTVGHYSHTFKGLSPDTLYKVDISAFEPGWKGSSDARYAETPAPGNPVISLDMGWRTATSVRLKGEITSTGTGPGPYAYLSEELKSNALVIVPKTQEPAGNLSVSDPNAVVVFNENWQEPNNVFDHYRDYFGLDPDTEYVAQAILTNIYDNTGYSNKVNFKTLAFPQIDIDEIAPQSHDAYVYADITVDDGDSVDGLGLFADDDDAEQPRWDSARIAGSLVSYNSATGRATFRLTALSANTAYDVQVYVRSGAGETWSQKSTFTTLPEPTAATITTQAATNIRNTKALMNATITDIGYSFVLEQGFVYSETNTNPLRGDADVTQVTVPITSQTAPSAIAALADGLTPNTTYYFQSFVRNNVGTTYGGVLTFTTQDAVDVDTLSTTSDLTTSGVTLYGEVISTGGLSPTLRGFVYSESAAPVLGASGVMSALDSVADASVGQFDATLSNLSAGTTYHYRAFVHNLQGTVYGDERTFTTASVATTLPAVTTNPIVTASITDDSAPVSGSFTTPSGTTVTETGFVYSKLPNPAMGDFNTASIPLSDTDGNFETTLSSLSANTTYYVRAYAKNENGYGYGNCISFKTKNEINAVSPVVIKSLTVDEVTANTVTVTLSTLDAPDAPAAGRYVLYSWTNTSPTSGAPGVNEASVSIIAGGVKTIEGLSPNKTYYLRGYTRNPDPILGGYVEFYGDILAITTDAFGPPVVTHNVPAVNTITDNGVKIHYQVNPNGLPVTKTAVVWSKDITAPTLGVGGVEMDEEDLFYGTTVITSRSLTGLTSNKTYYYAVYAYNAEGWSCSTVGSFTTLAGEIPVMAVIDVDPGTGTAAATAQLTQDGTDGDQARRLGVVVATVENPTIATPGAAIQYASGVNTDPFVVNFTGLSPSAQYYARAFACTLNDVYYYGDSVAFTTQGPSLASVVLYGPENIDATSADFLVSVLSGGGNPIIERGIVYNTSGSPDVSGNKVVCEGAGSSAGVTAAHLSGLSTGVKYYVRAYAATINGTAYSSQIAFTPKNMAATTPPPTTPPNDEPDNVYITRTLTDNATGVTISGIIHKDAVLTVKDALHTAGSCPACDEIHSRMDGMEFLTLFCVDISLSRGFRGPLAITFPVGNAYNGETATVLHCNNRTLQTFTITVKDGKATVTVTSLSPFAVFAIPQVITNIPKTGDGGGFPFGLGLSALGVLGFGLLLTRKKKRA